MSERSKVNLGIDGIRRSKEEDERISQVFASCLETPSGKEILRYLRSITIEMVNGPSVSQDSLMHIEGQRFIVGLIEQRVAHGHRSKKQHE